MYIMRESNLECPKCGKQSLVQRGSDLFACVSCDFKKDFAKPEKSESDESQDSVVELLLLLAGAIFLLALL